MSKTLETITYAENNSKEDAARVFCVDARRNPE